MGTRRKALRQLQLEVKNLHKKYGVNHKWYKEKKKELDDMIWSKDRNEDEWRRTQEEDGEQARSQDDSQDQDEDES